jgi:integrase
MTKELGAEPDRWTLHDLRRTFVTGLQSLGVSVEVAEACVNHKSGTLQGVTKVYARYEYADEKRKAFELWGRHVEVLAMGGNVVPLRGVG